MHPALLHALASRRTAELRAAASGRHQPARSRTPARPVRYRIGWALVHVGLRLAVGRERA
jgi:hypothetical protein